MWEVVEIFDTIFPAVPWDTLWGQLADQFPHMRDFALGDPVPAEKISITAPELIAALFDRAIGLGPIQLSHEAFTGLTRMLQAGHVDIFEHVLSKLLDDGGDARFLATDALTKVHTHPEVKARFSARLQSLVDDMDVGVHTAALLLAQDWGIDIVRKPRPLPAFYSLEFLASDEAVGNGLTDEQTRGLVVEDPLAWTTPWQRDVTLLAEASGIASEKLRRRIGQLIASWGGVEASGAGASRRPTRLSSDCRST